MNVWFARRGQAGLAGPDDELAGLGRRLTVADRACCCPARPVVTVIMLAAPGRPRPVDLLLCGHHYRVSRAALLAAGAAVYDEDGVLIPDGGSQPAARREPPPRRVPGSFCYAGRPRPSVFSSAAGPMSAARGVRS